LEGRQNVPWGHLVVKQLPWNFRFRLACITPFASLSKSFLNRNNRCRSITAGPVDDYSNQFEVSYTGCLNYKTVSLERFALPSRTVQSFLA
jgi:hypothetical protein